jgi:RNA polymerase sigma-70 factor (ECF subfamily)
MVETPPEASDRFDRDVDELLAARDGDQRAGRYLMSRHGPSMVRTAWSVLGRYGGTEAEDVIQEAFISALTTPALPTGDVGAWLRAITARKALDWLRRARRRGEQSLSEATSSGFEPVTGDNPESALDVLTLRRGLAQLSATDRAVLTLVDLEGLSMAEAAQAVGLTRVAVKLRASRARRKLARLLKPESRVAARPSSGEGAS